MSQATNIIDFILHRKRKQAQLAGRLMWAMYAQQAGFSAQPLNVNPFSSKAPRQA